MEQDIKIAILNEDKIDYIYRAEDSMSHSFLLNDYLKENYNISEIKDVDFENANSMSLYLREQGKIVFFNNTTYKNNKPSVHGTSGIIIIPDEMTEGLKNNLKLLNEKLQDYDRLEIWYDFASHMECKMIFTQAKEQVSTIIDHLLLKYESKKTK